MLFVYVCIGGSGCFGDIGSRVVCSLVIGAEVDQFCIVLCMWSCILL